MSDVGPKLSDRIYGRIIELIIDSSLVEGDKLPGEEELARRLGVSRPIVRQSLSQLNADGIVQTRQGAGSYVRTRPAARLVDYLSEDALAPAIGMFEVRTVMEPPATGLAAARRTREQLATLEHHFERIREDAERGSSALEADHAFHCAIMEATNNAVFVDAYAGIAGLIVQGMRAGLALSRSPGTPIVDVEEHANILRAIRSKDEKAADLAMRWHLWQSRQRLIGRSGPLMMP